MTQAVAGASTTVKRVGRRLLIVLAVLAALIVAAFWAFRNAGRWLLIQDTLQPARAIVVLSGLTPYHAMEAAQIYRQGWAREVWLFKDDPRGADEAFAKLAIHHISEEEYDKQVLERLGVLPAARFTTRFLAIARSRLAPKPSTPGTQKIFCDCLRQSPAA
jgi:hypothetical protein